MHTVEELRNNFPSGHPEFIPTLIDSMQLHSDKNHDYAHTGPPLGNFERVAAILALYPGLPLQHPVTVMMLYMLKQFDAVLWGLSHNLTHKVEGPLSRLRDILVYAGIAICWFKDHQEPPR